MEKNPILILDFPSFAYKLQKSAEKLLIFDEVSKKNRVLTPEEWVRQHCLNYLIHHLNYPSNLIQLEAPIFANQLKRRSDICIYDRNGKLFLLIECKAPQVNLDASVLQQVSQYQSVLKSPFWAITNGLEHKIFTLNQENQVTILDFFPKFQ